MHIVKRRSDQISKEIILVKAFKRSKQNVCMSFWVLVSGNLVELVQLTGLWSGRFFIGRLAAGEECFTVTSRRR